MQKLRKFSIALSLISGIVSAKLCGAVALSDEQIAQANIQILTAKESRIISKTCAMGKIAIKPDNLAHVVAATDAVVREVKKGLGDEVAAEEILAVLESQEVAELKANYLASLKKETLSENLFHREEELRSKQISPEQDLLNAQHEWETAKIATELNKQKLFAFGLNEEEIKNLSTDKLEQDFRLFYLRAPIGGTVIKKHLTTGEVIHPEELAFEIANLKKVWVEIGIYPKDLAYVREGQRVEVTSDHIQKPAEAKIIYISPTMDEQSRTAKAIAEIDNSNKKWKPGTFVCANIVTSVVKVPIAVSKEAVQKMDGEDVVFVKTAEGFEKKAVKLGRSDAKNVEIVSGLESGEQYAGDNSFILKAELSREGE